jgi:hypothetical protein
MQEHLIESRQPVLSEDEGRQVAAKKSPKDLPPDLAAFAKLLDAQPEPVRNVFNYCLALMMVEAGKARVIETRPGETGTICVFESTAGDVFSLARPAAESRGARARLSYPWFRAPAGSGLLGIHR